jgi:putative membrane protein
MAAVGIGLGFNALFGELQPPWAPKALATAFLVIAIFVFLAAQRRAIAITSRLEPHAIKALKPMNIRLLSLALTAATAALIAAIWALV